jgi:hypothetical protein
MTLRTRLLESCELNLKDAFLSDALVFTRGGRDL